MDVLSAFLDGQVAMIELWPPIARWSEGYGTDTEQLAWVPKSKIAGKVGYALPPGGFTEMAGGFTLSISSDSKHKEAAYLFIQWLTSKKISLERVQLPYALRDPYRLSHYNSLTYRELWPTASDYLKLLSEAGVKGLLDLSIIQTSRYEQALAKGLVAAFSGLDPKFALDNVASSWDSLTQAIGVDKQRSAYKAWFARPGAYPR
jgi:multiple sugar transport system substrate-binding protein